MEKETEGRHGIRINTERVPGNEDEVEEEDSQDSSEKRIST